jgi:hypothetical protein
MHLICSNCQSESDVLLIDCSLTLGSIEHEASRYCFSWRKEARHPVCRTS